MANRTGIQARLPQFIFIIVVATVLAAGLFLAIPYLQSRPQYPRGTFPVVVENNEVLVVMNPEQEVALVPLPGEPDLNAGTGGQTVQLATATPVILPTAGPTALPTPLPPTAVPPTPLPAADSIIFVNHVVQPGETLYSISNKYVTSIELMARFGISSASLVPGATIRVPVGNPAYCPAGWRPYPVTQGETAFSIAQKCGITVAELAQVNRLDSSNTIFAASIICVPQ